MLFLGCDSSYKEEKKSYLTLRNAHNSSLVPTNAYLYLDFSKDIDASTVTSDTFYLLDNNGTKIDGVLQIQLNRVTFLPTHYLNPL
ncbi:MAG: Ig-like domain-containing protein, partial [Campylobacterota bacterium]|nr:Ig-like domain-containing protein [Campylobacterota bacterium]